jgi:ketosteroid isomerase-like protein
LSESSGSDKFTPLDLLDRLRRAIEMSGPSGLFELLADDAVVEFPFAPAGSPKRLLGREAVRSYFAKLQNAPRLDIEKLRAVAVHRTEDPEVIVAELELIGTRKGSSHRFRLPSIAVIRVRRGRIVGYRDYYNPPAAAEASGRTEEILAGATRSRAALTPAAKGNEKASLISTEEPPVSSVPKPAGPGEVFERVHRLLLDHDLDAYADLFAAYGAIDLPFAPPGIPRRVQGREEIRAFFAAAGDRLQGATRLTEFRAVVVHETLDPEVVVTEFEAHGEITATGQPYQFRNFQVMRVREGEIVSLRDYWNPLDRPEFRALGSSANP